MIDLSRLISLIEQLKLQAADVDRKRGESFKPLFDETLFKTRSKLLTPCVNEVHNELQLLQKEQQAGRLLPARTQHLCEKIVSQIQAIQRELATLNIRKKEPKNQAGWRRPINEIYQDLNQHKDWERRLKAMLRDKELLISRCASQFEQQQLQKEILALEGRISRCQAALIKIETDISNRERKG
ncbi:hypothetical primosomal replication protein N'' [Photobacterium sp. SKA34]|uniref:primosomal replication protein PriC n=1 Tax=Photobacterium sp. SKA34 TaxID=121723 RepID=UPI00006AEE4A|nr:primosomal replication protein [Photobacterium sp. SKA34]EAR56221.1 hypothetical primosomal replication protein N'' [Photobacterium sp. SKA34]